METPQHVELEHHITPTLYLCAGVSGAGCTTAVDAISRSGLALAGPGQVVSRQARSGEMHAGVHRGPGGGIGYAQYYFVAPEHMSRVKNHLQVAHVKYGNTYGLTNPSLQWIRGCLKEGKNVIIDALGSKTEWGHLLSGKPVVLLYFAPNDPIIAKKRLVNRRKMSEQVIDEQAITLRVQANAENIAKEIFTYDYWVDTTILEEVVPAVISLIHKTSGGITTPLHPRVIPIQQNSDQVNNLIVRYQKNLPFL